MYGTRSKTKRKINESTVTNSKKSRTTTTLVPFERHRRYPLSRQFDPSDEHAVQTRVAHDQFKKMVSLMPVGPSLKHHGQTAIRARIESIDHVVNETLEDRFEEFKSKLVLRGVDASELLLFHGTEIENIDGILERGFDPRRILNTRYGHGHYFSEFPSISINYGESLLLCRVLLGSVQPIIEGPIFKPDLGYDSHSVQLMDINDRSRLGFFGNSAEQCSEIYVIKNCDQVLPICVLNFAGSMPSCKNLKSVVSETLATSDLQQCKVCYKRDYTVDNRYGPNSCIWCRSSFFNSLCYLSEAVSSFFANFQCSQIHPGLALCINGSVRDLGIPMRMCNYCCFARCLMVGFDWTIVQRQLRIDQRELKSRIKAFVNALDKKQIRRSQLWLASPQAKRSEVSEVYERKKFH